MPKPRREFIDTEYGQMHVRVATPQKAEHTPLICLHMSPKSGRLFEDFMTAASDDRIVIAPDYPGCGESDRPPADPPIRIQDYARTMWQVLDGLDIKHIDILGHHTGSKVAAEMAHQRPDAVGSIVMISALMLTEDEQKGATAEFKPTPLDDDGTRFSQFWNDLIKYRGPGMTLEMMAISMAESVRCGETYNWGQRAAYFYNKDFRRVLESLDHKVTVINPGDDLFKLTPRVMDALQNGKLINKPEWGHGFLDAFTEDAVNTIKRALD